MKSQKEKFVAKMEVEREDHSANVKIMKGKHGKLTIKVEELEKNFQKKCEETEGLHLIIEEKENMDTAKAEAGDSEHLNVVLDDEENLWRKKALCSNLQSRKLHQKLLSRMLLKRMMSRNTV